MAGYSRILALAAIVLLLLAAAPKPGASAMVTGHWTISYNFNIGTSSGGATSSSTGSGSGDIYVNSQGQVSGSGTGQGSFTLSMSGTCSGGGTFGISETDTYSGQEGSDGTGSVTIQSTTSGAPSSITVTCSTPSGPVSEQIPVSASATGAQGTFQMQFTTTSYSQSFPAPAGASGSINVEMTYSGGGTTTTTTVPPTTSNQVTTTAPPPTTTSTSTGSAQPDMSMEVATNGGGVTITSTSTGQTQTGNTLSPGDYYHVGVGGIIGMTCPGTVVCPPGTLPVEFGSGSTGGILEVQGTSANDVAFAPNDAGTQSQLFGSTALEVATVSLVARMLAYGFLAVPAGTIFGVEIAFVLLMGLVYVKWSQITTTVSNGFDMLGITHDTVVVDQGTEYTMIVTSSGTMVDVLNGSLAVGSIATGQITLVGANQSLFIPSDPTLAGEQNLTLDVASLDMATVNEWWTTPLTFPATTTSEVTTTTAGPTTTAAPPNGSSVQLKLPGWMTFGNEGLLFIAAAAFLLIISIPLGRRPWRAWPRRTGPTPAHLGA